MCKLKGSFEILSFYCIRALPSPCTSSGSMHFCGSSFERKKTRSNLLTRNAYTALNNEAQEVRALCLLYLNLKTQNLKLSSLNCLS